MTRGQERAAKVAKWTLGAMVALWALYVVAINVFLSSSLFAKVVDADPMIVDVHYLRGWSLVPGRIHARGLSIRGRDANVEWILRVDDVTFDLSLYGLARRRFEVSEVRGDGVALRLRQRLEHEPATDAEKAEVQDLPPVDGFAPWSVRPPDDHAPDVWDDRAYRLWTVHLEDVHAEHVREIWLDRIRFTGDASIHGRFYLRPIRRVNVGPADVVVRSGRVDAGPHPLGEGLHAQALVTVDDFDPRTDTGDLIHRISVKGAVTGDVPEIASLPIHWPDAIHGAGRAEVHDVGFVVDHGRLGPDVKGEIVMPRVALDRTDQRLEATIRTTFEAPLVARVELKALALRRNGVMVVHGEHASIAADAPSVDLADPTRHAHAVVKLDEGVLDDAHVLDAYVPEETPLGFVRGRATANARLEAWLGERRATASGDLHADELDLHVAKTRLRGKTSCALRLGTWRLDTHRAEDASLVLDVADGAIATERAPETPLVTISSLHAAANAGVLDLADPLAAFDVTVAMPDATIAAPTLLQRYVVKDGAMKVGRTRFTLGAKLAVKDHRGAGTLDLRANDLRLTTIDDVAVDAGVRVAAAVHDWRWEHGDLALDRATLAVSPIVVRRAGIVAATIAGVDVTATSARFDLTDPLAKATIDARVKGGFVRDAKALDAFLPEHASFSLDANDGRFAGTLHADVERHVARGRVAFRTERLGFATTPIRLLADADVTADVAQWDVDRATLAFDHARIQLHDAVGSFHADRAREISAKAIVLDGKTGVFPLAHPTLRGVDARLTVTGAEIPDARVLGELLPSDSIVRIDSGRATGDADLTISASERRTSGRVHVDIARAGVTVDRSSVRGDVAVDLRLGGYDPIDLSGSHVTLRHGQSKENDDWRADAVVERGTLRLGGIPLVDGSVRLRATDATLLYDVLFHGGLPGFVEGLIGMPDLVATAHLTASPHELALRDLSAKGGDVHVDGSFGLANQERRGAFVVSKGPLMTGVRVTNDGVALRPLGLDGWLADQKKQVERLVSAKAKR